MGTLDFGKMAIVPSLLSNCGVWIEINNQTVQKLAEIQNAYVRRGVLHVPLLTEYVNQYLLVNNIPPFAPPLIIL